MFGILTRQERSPLWSDTCQVLLSSSLESLALFASALLPAELNGASTAAAKGVFATSNLRPGSGGRPPHRMRLASQAQSGSDSSGLQPSLGDVAQDPPRGKQAPTHGKARAQQPQKSPEDPTLSTACKCTPAPSPCTVALFFCRSCKLGRSRFTWLGVQTPGMEELQQNSSHPRLLLSQTARIQTLLKLRQVDFARRCVR